MKKWFKFLLIAIIALVVAIALGFLFVVHIPYSDNVARLNRIRDDIVAANQYEYNGYFNEYQGDDLYYILEIVENDENFYVVINDENQLVAKRPSNPIDTEQVLGEFREEYGFEPSKIEVGYENSTMVYALKYVGEEELIYAYYNINTGVLIKAYIL